MNEPESQLLIYQLEDRRTRIDVRLEDETVWLTQAQMVELFQTTKQNTSLHVRNIFSEGELKESSVVKEYLTTALDGKKYVLLWTAYPVEHEHRREKLAQECEAYEQSPKS